MLTRTSHIPASMINDMISFPKVGAVQAENKKLAEPLKKAKEELHRLKVGSSHYFLSEKTDA